MLFNLFGVWPLHNNNGVTFNKSKKLFLCNVHKFDNLFSVSANQLLNLHTNFNQTNSTKMKDIKITQLRTFFAYHDDRVE